MLSRKRSGYRLVLKSLHSTMIINKFPTSISYPGTFDEKLETSAPAGPHVSVRIDLKHKLAERYNHYVSKPCKVLDSKPLTETRSINKLRKHLMSGEYLKFLIEFVLRWKSDPTFITATFNSRAITHEEYSVFINGLLSRKNMHHQLDDLFPDTLRTDIIFKLYEVYKDVLVQDRMTPLLLHDLNMFTEHFIESSQLSKAQNVLQLILDSNNGELPCDPVTAVHFLQLRCGALTRNWKGPSVNSRAGKKLGSYSNRCKVANSYKTFDQRIISELIEELHKPNTMWAQKRTCELDSALMYSLAHMGQLPLLEKHMEQNWGISPNKYTKIDVPENIYPNSQLLIAILSCYASKNQFAVALELVDSFISRFPGLELNVLFWRRLFQWSKLLWDEKTDPKGTVSRSCWRVFKEWHDQRGKQVPYDSGLLNERYYILRNTNDYIEAIQIFEQCLSQMYVKQNLRHDEFAVIEKFQKLVLKKMGLLGYYNKPLQFIKEWSLDESNAKHMNAYFQKHRQKYQGRLEKHKKRLQSKQQAFDEEDEDDMIIGRLW